MQNGDTLDAAPGATDYASEIENLIRSAPMAADPGAAPTPFYDRSVARVNSGNRRLMDRMADERFARDYRIWQDQSDRARRDAETRINGLIAINRITNDQAALRRQEVMEENNIRASTEAVEMMRALPSINVQDPDYSQKIAEIRAQFPAGAQTPAMRDVLNGYARERYEYLDAKMKAQGGITKVLSDLRRNGATEDEIRAINDPATGSPDLEAADRLIYDLSQRNMQARSQATVTRGIARSYQSASSAVRRGEAEVAELERQVAGARREERQAISERLNKARTDLAGNQEVLNGLLEDYPSLAAPQASASTAPAQSNASQAQAQSGATPAQPAAAAQAPVAQGGRFVPSGTSAEDRARQLEVVRIANSVLSVNPESDIEVVLRNIQSDEGNNAATRAAAEEVLNNIRPFKRGDFSAQEAFDMMTRELSQEPSTQAPAQPQAGEPVRSMTLSRYKQITGDSEASYAPGTRLRDQTGKVIVIAAE